MKKVVQVLLVLALAAAVIGYFRNWYTVTQVNEEQKTNINIAIDRQRIKEDLNLAAEKAKGISNRVSGQGGDEGSKEDPSATNIPVESPKFP